MSNVVPGAPPTGTVFLDTMEDLRRRSDLRATEYDMAQSAGLVRRLLIDSRPLYLAVNEAHRLKVEFVVGNLFVAVPTSTESAWVQGPWLDAKLTAIREQPWSDGKGQGPEVYRPAVLKLKDFLGHSAAVRRINDSPEESASVKDVIRLYANMLGGVHNGMEKNPNPLLVEIIGESEPYLRETMSAVARTVYRALEPLAYREVLTSRPHPFGLVLSSPSQPGP